jgi:type I restriction enzyme M protein
MNTKEVIDRIFKEPGVQFELTEFENLGKPIHEILSVYPKAATTGKDAGKTKYYLKSLIPFSTGNEEVQVYAEGGKSAPEEIVRQLWVYKLMHQYGYRADEIDLEKDVQFGTEIGTKAADIIVYTDATKLTPKIIVECKKPKRKDGIEQLKSYMNAKGAPVAVWSNGADSIILYRPTRRSSTTRCSTSRSAGRRPRMCSKPARPCCNSRRTSTSRRSSRTWKSWSWPTAARTSSTKSSS